MSKAVVVAGPTGTFPASDEGGNVIAGRGTAAVAADDAVLIDVAGNLVERVGGRQEFPDAPIGLPRAAVEQVEPIGAHQEVELAVGIFRDTPDAIRE